MSQPEKSPAFRRGEHVNVLIFATNLSGEMLWKQPAGHPEQPHVVKLATIISDDVGFTPFAMLIKPKGWEVSPGEVDRHGVTTEIAETDGSELSAAVGMFMEMVHEADVVSGFYVDLPIRAMRSAVLRSGVSEEDADTLSAMIRTKRHDVMKQATDVCKIPPTHAMLGRGQRGFKPPKLTEAAQILFGETLPEVRDAAFDVDVIARLYRHLNPAGGLRPIGEVVEPILARATGDRE